MSRRKKKEPEEPKIFYLVYRKVFFGHLDKEYMLDDKGKVRKFDTRRGILRLTGCSTEAELNKAGMYIAEEVRK